MSAACCLRSIDEERDAELLDTIDRLAERIVADTHHANVKHFEVRDKLVDAFDKHSAAHKAAEGN